MKKHVINFAGIILLVATGFFVLSCNSGKSENDSRQAIISSFIAAHKAFVSTNPPQDAFFARFTKTVGDLDDNRTIAIDTKALDSLLTLAKAANAKRRQLVNETVVQDSTILYHDKANELINRIDSFYQKFPELIQVLQTNSEDRYGQYLKLMTDPLAQMRRAQEKYQEASDSMTNKYSIRVTN